MALLPLHLPEVNTNLLAQLEAMGFTVPQALNALHFSGNTSVEAAIDWIIDHDNEGDSIDHMPPVSLDIPIEGPTPSQVFDQQSEQGLKEKEEEEKVMDKDDEKSSSTLAAQHVKSEETEQKRYLSEWKAKKVDNRRANDGILQKSQQDKNLQLAESVRKVEVMEECLRSIRRQNLGNDIKVTTAFQTLLVYVRNVANFPDNGRFRRIRLTNPAFQNRVGNFRGGIEFLELCGFVKVDSGEFLFLPRDKVDMRLLKTACDFLHSAITNPYFGLLSRPTRQAT